MSAADSHIQWYAHAIADMNSQMTEPIPNPETPTITSIRGKEIQLVLPDGTRQYTMLDCECLQCASVKRGLDMAALMRQWDKGRAAREVAEIVRREARKRADDKARALLFTLLTPEQATSLRGKGYFVLQSQNDRTYRISVGFSGNVTRIFTGKTYCCYLNQTKLPTYDHMIGQLLALKYNEDLFLQTAY